MKIETKYHVGQVVQMQYYDMDHRFHILEILTVTCIGGTQVYYKGRMHTQSSSVRSEFCTKSLEIREDEIRGLDPACLKGEK